MLVSDRARSLRCILSGKVVSLGEVHDSSIKSRCGYAVFIRRRTAAEQWAVQQLRRRLPWLAERLLKNEVEMTAPADGVVTRCENGVLTLRTGDGIAVEVALGDGFSLLPEVGEQVRTSTVICRSSVQALERSGSVAVFFPEPCQITELHIFSGRRKIAHRTAFYRVPKR